MLSFLSVTNEDLERLDAQQAVEFFRKLLWAEAASLGISKSLINVPSAITVGDGGVDAEVRDANIGGDLIKPGLTRYQIKTGDFTRTKSDLRTLFYKGKSNQLHPRVQACFDRGGTFVVVLFGWDNPDDKDVDVVQQCRQLLNEHHPQYSERGIEVWRQNNLIAFLTKYPSLALDLTGRQNLRFQTHRSWALDAEMQLPLQLGSAQHEFIRKLRSELRNQHRDAIHVRILGEAGIGKTRLVLESTREEDVAPFVVYYDNASRFLEDQLLTDLLREDNTFEVVLILDDCAFDTSIEVWNKLKHRGPRIKLVTLYQDFDKGLGTSIVFETPPLDGAAILEIIQSYGIPKDGAARWAPECGGSPRVAHAVGANLRSNPEDLRLDTPDIVHVWNRYILGIEDPKSDRAYRRRLILQYLALFKRFGFGRHLVNEAKAIQSLVVEADPQVTWPRFEEEIAALRKRKILQGETTLYYSGPQISDQAIS